MFRVLEPGKIPRKRYIDTYIVRVHKIQLKSCRIHVQTCRSKRMGAVRRRQTSIPHMCSHLLANSISPRRPIKFAHTKVGTTRRRRLLWNIACLIIIPRVFSHVRVNTYTHTSQVHIHIDSHFLAHTRKCGKCLQGANILQTITRTK